MGGKSEKYIDKLNKHLEALTQFFSFSKNYKIHHPNSKLVIEFSILENENGMREILQIYLPQKTFFINQ